MWLYTDCGRDEILDRDDCVDDLAGLFSHQHPLAADRESRTRGFDVDKPLLDETLKALLGG
jgi:hypothetical protein